MELAAQTELMAADVVKAAIAEGLLLVPAGAKVLRFVPPLIVTAQEVDVALHCVERAIANVNV
jgi:acetylornithine aminotransferase